MLFWGEKVFFLPFFALLVKRIKSFGSFLCYFSSDEVLDEACVLKIKWLQGLFIKGVFGEYEKTCSLNNGLYGRGLFL